MKKKKYAKTPTIYQMEATECGAASLSMIMGYYGKHMALEQLRMETGVSRDGCNAMNILRAARKFGLEAKGLRKGLEELLECQPPCIIHWNFNHFVVWEGMKGKHAYINDPAVGRRKLTIQDVDDCFTGIVLVFKKTDSFERQKEKKTLLSFIRRRLKGQYVALAALAAIGLCLVFPGMVVPVFSQVFIDYILLGGNTRWITVFLAVMGFTVLFRASLTFYRGYLLEKLQNKMALVSAHSFLYHMFRLPIGFFDQRYSGDLAERVENNNKVSTFLAGDLAETVLNIMVAAFYLALLLLYSPLLTLIGICSVAINVIIMKCSSDAIANASMKQQQDQGKLVGAVFAGLNITSTLKASGAENEYISRIQGYYAKAILLEQKLGRLQQVLNAIPAVANETVPMTAKLSGEVELRNIAFGYSILEKPLVEGFCFQLNSGSSIAFVGASGCGKSTVSKIVSGLYIPWEGEVLMDGLSCRKIPKEIMASSVSTVSQSITLFSGTIRDNLTMWNRNVLEQDIITAAKDACIHDVITSKPGAYDFMLTEGGTNLSGGQRQRLEIARALVTNPSILIMDEATSALDPIVEKQIIDNIKRRGCTCIIVAHRLSAIRDCDEIIVMERGKIVQRGTHESLMAIEGHYQRLIRNI